MLLIDRDMFKFVLIEVCLVDVRVTCLRVSTGFEGTSFREARL